MPITNYSLYSERVLPGSIASTLSCDIVSRLNSSNEAIPYGSAVVYDPSLESGVSLPSSLTDIFAGIAVRTYLYEDESDSISNEKQFDVLLKGEIAVFVDTAVSVGDPVFFRVAPNTGNILGSFRNNADTTGEPADTCLQISKAQWVKGTMGPGTAILRLNEV